MQLLDVSFKESKLRNPGKADTIDTCWMLDIMGP
jgi:hypothetical protein